MKDKSIIHDIIFYAFVLLVVALLVLPGNIGKEEDEKIVGIDIKGEVRAPGYYELEYGSRIKDALIVAGGETENADLSSINLALNLKDGEEIVIPKAGDNSKAKNDLININTADVYTLSKLDGIGEELANDIVNFRAKKGTFKTVKEIKKVKGIGKEKFDKIKDKITVN